MHVPIFVPSAYRSSSSHERTTVVNKQIVYQDAILDLKDKGGNLKVTQISVPVSELENCLNIIFEANPDVVFNTVQYSYKNKKVVFYTDRSISAEKWEKRNEKTYKPVTESATLVEQIQSVLDYEDDLNAEHISVYSVWSVYNHVDNDLEKKRKKLQRQIEAVVRRVNNEYYVCLHEPRLGEEEVSLAIETGKWNTFYFRKEKGDLYIHRTDGNVNFNVLSLVGSYIEEYYDYCNALKQVAQSAHDVLPINSCFRCHFMEPAVYIGDHSWVFSQTFTVRRFSNGNEFECNCNSNDVQQLLRGRVNEFVQKVFVKISDCPEWMQEKLREMRETEFKQIVAEQKEKEEEERRQAEEERLVAEKIARELAKKQRRRDFWKKIFPFIK